MEDDTTELDDGPEVEELIDDEALIGGDDPDNPEGEPEEEPDDSIEIEKDGKRLRIPATLKDEFMFHADYTRKTQEIAAQRKDLETKLTEAAQASDDEINCRAAAVAVDAAIRPYEELTQADWDNLEQQDPASAQRHFRTFIRLQGQQGQLKTDLQEAVSKRVAGMQRATAEQVEQRIAEVRRDIPDWGDAKAETLMAFGEAKLGLTREQMLKVDGSSDRDPILCKLLNALYVSSQPKAEKPPRIVTEPKPAAKVKGGSAPRKPLDDRSSAEDWVKARNAQIARR